MGLLLVSFAGFVYLFFNWLFWHLFFLILFVFIDWLNLLFFWRNLRNLDILFIHLIFFTDFEFVRPILLLNNEQFGIDHFFGLLGCGGLRLSWFLLSAWCWLPT
jgi:hypothetical protein